MKKSWRGMALALAILLCFSLTGCGSTRVPGYEVISRLDSEEFTVAFRYEDPICDIVTAAMEELAAEGLFSRLSLEYLGADYSCLEGQSGALKSLPMEIPAEKTLLVGVQNGASPLSSQDDSGNFIGMIPDLVQAVAEKLGWSVVYTPVYSENAPIQLASGNVDCVWVPASYSANSTEYSVSPGWLENAHLLVVRQGSGLHKVRDLKKHNVGVTDSTSLNALKNNTKIFDAVTIWNYGDIRSCFTALASGDCDALVVDSIVSGQYVS